MHTFPTPGPTTLVVQTSNGDVTVRATDTAQTTVELTPLNPAGETAVAQAVVEQRGGAVVVRLARHRGGLLRQGPSVAVSITCPTGTSLDVKADAADIRATGSYAHASISSGSGDIEVEELTGAAKLKSGSGAVTVGHAGDVLVVSTGSGDVLVDRSSRNATLSAGSGDISIGTLGGQAVVRTGSGDVEVGVLEGALLTKTGSGDLTVRRATRGSVKATGASGDISLGVQRGTAAWLDVSTVTGRIRQELDESAPPDGAQERLEISAQTVSGELRVHRS